MTDLELDDVEQEFARIRLRRQLLFGFTGVTVGTAMVVLAVLMVVVTWGQRRPPLRMAMAGLIVGVGFVFSGVRTLRRGELDEGGRPVEGGAPVPLKLLMLSSAGIVCAIVLVAAWPLGFYDWLGGLGSGCRKLLTAEDITTIGGPPLVVDRVYERSRDCRLLAEAPAGSDFSHALLVDIRGEWGPDQFTRHMEYLGGDAEPIDGLGDRAELRTKRHLFTIGFQKAHAGAVVQLPRDLYTEAQARKAIDILRGRTAVLEPYSEAWISKYGR